MRTVIPIREDIRKDVVYSLLGDGFRVMPLERERYFDDYMKKREDGMLIFAWKDEVRVDDDELAYFKAGYTNSFPPERKDSLKGFPYWNKPFSTVEEVENYLRKGSSVIPSKIWYEFGYFIRQTGEYVKMFWEGMTSLGGDFPAFVFPLVPHISIDAKVISILDEYGIKDMLVFHTAIDKGIKVLEDRGGVGVLRFNAVADGTKIGFVPYYIYDLNSMEKIGVKIQIFELERLVENTRTVKTL